MTDGYEPPSGISPFYNIKIDIMKTYKVFKLCSLPYQQRAVAAQELVEPVGIEPTT